MRATQWRPSRPYLVKPSLNVTDCLQQAARSELEATRTRDPAARDFFLDVADRWHRIATTFTYIEQRRRPSEETRVSPRLRLERAAMSADHARRSGGR